MSEISKELRLELNSLSKEVFGASSRWRTILKNGQLKLITRKSLETVPGKDGEEPTVKEVEVPILTASGAKQSIVQRYTPEEVRDLLIGFKKQRDEMMGHIKKQQEEKAENEAKEKALKAIQQDAQGTATV